MWTEPFEGSAELAALASSLGRAPGLAWLDGEADTHEAEGRWSFLASAPVEVRRVPFGDPAPLRALDGLEGVIGRENGGEGPSPARVPRWIGYVAYDAAWSGATRTPARLAREALPVVWMGRYDAVLAIDHDTGRRWLVGDSEAACRALRARLATLPAPVDALRVGVPEAEPADGHRAAIERALAHIAAGDIYQVNLARRWTAAFSGAPLALFLAMRRTSAVPLGMYLDAGDHAVLCRTMERFLRWERASRDLRTRPIKGTLARSGHDDAGEAEALRADPKERAEHVMIVDLMRNDLGRVAETGSVEVCAPLSVEPYTGLSHLVSTVRCTTRPGVGLRDIVEATFPPGSVTGAPKVRAVEIIEALERSPRGVYCGAVGYVDRAGGASLAVAIRTAVVHGGTVRYHAGGGLVAASEPAREIAETELKARVFLEAIEALRR